MQTLIRRARAAGGPPADDLRRAHAWLVDIAHGREPDAPDAPLRRQGARVRQEVEALRAAVPARSPAGQVPAWLAQPVADVGLVLRRLGAGLDPCYDVPGLPRTDTALEQFSRQLTAGERRATGHRRSDAFVVRCGGFAAAAASTRSEPELREQLATVSAYACQRARRDLRATYERQAKMHRFHLRPQRYLSDLEARWNQLTGAP